MNDEPLNNDGKGMDDELRVCRGLGKLSTPLELAFASNVRGRSRVFSFATRRVKLAPQILPLPLANTVFILTNPRFKEQQRMSSKDGRIVISRQSKQESASESPLPTCNPNLMPFHIKYTGPAAVSMFFHVEKMKVEEGEEKEGEGVKEQNDKEEVEENHPKPTGVTSTTVSSGTSILKDVDRRFVSSFRGRTIHGLTVDVPTGYTGLLLQHDDPSPQPPSHPPAESRVKNRVLNNPKNHTIENDSVENTNEDFEMDEELVETTSLRKLIPQSTFSSITLWHADRAVDETRDEYYRTLTEWMALSHEVSKTCT